MELATSSFGMCAWNGIMMTTLQDMKEVAKRWGLGRLYDPCSILRGQSGLEFCLVAGM